MTYEAKLSDNILVTHEVIHTMRRSKSSNGMLAIKLDVTKAYDKLGWTFIEWVLKEHNFPSWWIERIMEYVNTTYYSILIDGCKSRTISPTKGLRQGDHLSLCLFILPLDVLLRTLDKNSI